MKRVDITDTLELSRIAFGMWRLADAEDASPKNISAKIKACLDQGITTMDQADIYGDYNCEALFGEALKHDKSIRQNIEIITKCGIVAPVGRYSSARVKHYDTSRDHIFASVETSLKAMGTDWIDMLLIHRPDPLMDARETGAVLDDLIASGKVRAVGVSNFRPFDIALLQSAMRSPIAANQIEMSVLENDAFTNGDLAYLQEKAISAMAWSPLGGGALFDGTHDTVLHKMQQVADETGVDIAAVAIAWLLAHPVGIMPVVGTNNLQRINKLSDAFKVSLDRETWFDIYTAALGKEVP